MIAGCEEFCPWETFLKINDDVISPGDWFQECAVKPAEGGKDDDKQKEKHGHKHGNKHEKHHHSHKHTGDDELCKYT